jgi:predicted metal-dependent peptidase
MELYTMTTLSNSFTKAGENQLPPFDLNQHIVGLLRDEPFFAALSRRMEKVASKSVPTAGVRFNEDKCRFELFYNPDFMAKMLDQDIKYVKGVLLHEFYHIMLLHVTSRLPDGKMTKKWNIATDLAINSELTVFAGDTTTLTGYQVESSLLPVDMACIPTVGIFAGLAPHLSAEQYMVLLPDSKEEEEKEKGEGESEPGEPGEEDGEGGEGGMGEESEGGEGGEGGEGTPSNEPGSDSGNGFDDHSDWGDSDGTDEKRKIAEERLKEAIKEAYVEAMSRGFGSVSASMKRTIKEVITPKVNWRSILRSFVKASQRADRTSTIKRLNRRYAYIHPGRKAKRQAKIAVSIDQSGSVSDTMLIAFYSELEKLSQIADFTIVPFDTEVAEEHVHVWKKGARHEKTRYKHGGTCFNAPTKWVNEHKFDGHIVLTDMEAPKPIPSKCQRMWMTTKAHADRPYFQTNERVIAIND